MPNTDLQPPFKTHTGNDPYIFVSYAHKDEAVVFPEIDNLHSRGYRIWYDEGIDPGNEWPEEIAKALVRASVFMVFISPNAVASQNVRNEINFAFSRKKPFIAVYITKTQLPLGLELTMGSFQSILKYRLALDDYFQILLKALPTEVRRSKTGQEAPPRSPLYPIGLSTATLFRRPNPAPISESIVSTETLSDNFSGNIVSSNKWHISTLVSPFHQTFIGRTQFRCTPNSPLPAVNDSNAIITVETYNPTGFSSFYGTDLISNLAFPLEKGVHITVRAKMNTPKPGIVGGIFLYALKPGSTTHRDEIDFELLSNLPNGAQTNIYSNEPLGPGHPQFVSYTSGSITDYHTYEIKWQPNQVSWFIDGNLVRTEISHIPTGPMNFHLNIWVPDSGWVQAYSPNLKPTTSSSSNQVFWMSVDSVTIEFIT